MTSTGSFFGGAGVNGNTLTGIAASPRRTSLRPSSAISAGLVPPSSAAAAAPAADFSAGSPSISQLVASLKKTASPAAIATQRKEVLESASSQLPLLSQVPPAVATPSFLQLPASTGSAARRESLSLKDGDGFNNGPHYSSAKGSLKLQSARGAAGAGSPVGSHARRKSLVEAIQGVQDDMDKVNSVVASELPELASEVQALAISVALPVIESKVLSAAARSRALSSAGAQFVADHVHPPQPESVQETLHRVGDVIRHGSHATENNVPSSPKRKSSLSAKAASVFGSLGLGSAAVAAKSHVDSLGAALSDKLSGSFASAGIANTQAALSHQAHMITTNINTLKQKREELIQTLSGLDEQIQALEDQSATIKVSTAYGSALPASGGLDAAPIGIPLSQSHLGKTVGSARSQRASLLQSQLLSQQPLDNAPILTNAGQALTQAANKSKRTLSNKLASLRQSFAQ